VAHFVDLIAEFRAFEDRADQPGAPRTSVERSVISPKEPVPDFWASRARFSVAGSAPVDELSFLCLAMSVCGYSAKEIAVHLGALTHCDWSSQRVQARLSRFAHRTGNGSVPQLKRDFLQAFVPELFDVHTLYTQMVEMDSP